jgi:predicted HTH transcriptional regulator
MTARTTTGRRSLFVSSVQKELEHERRAIKDYVQGDALLRRYLDTFLFEDLPASDHRADDVYLEEVERCDVYLGIFGSEYGFEDPEGLSPTEREFDLATAKGKPRLIFVKGKDDKARHPKMLELIRKAGSQLIRRRFTSISDLTAGVYAALVEHLERVGELRTLPFDASACPRAGLGDIASTKMKWFLAAARRERNYALSEKTAVDKALAHLNLLDGTHPSHAAVLLFGDNPQRFLPTAEIKCLHFHGTEVRKPIPSYQIYKGTLFDQVDMAVDFVMSKIARSVGTRAKGPKAPVEYELPKDVVFEAVVNAVAHRDYTSNAGIQVMLFSNRLEVWNPGELPSTLTPESLRKPHSSIPRNPLIADPFFLAHYIEKAGTGTLDMIERCRDVGLPEPDFEQRAGQFVATIWRDWLTDEVMARLGLSERQKKAVAYAKANGRITNKEYQQFADVSDRTVLRELNDLLDKGVFDRIGKTGRATHYVIGRAGRRTRQEPDKSDIGKPAGETRQEPDKPDRGG